MLDREEPSTSSFQPTINVDSVDTANEKRDYHLRQPDDFDTKQFPTITFVSTKVKAVDGGYEVTGDFTMHGVTKEVTFPFICGEEVEKMAAKRVGFGTELKLKRSDFDFDPQAIGNIGDEAIIIIDCAGVEAS